MLADLTITLLCVDDEDDLVPEFDVGLALWPGKAKPGLADKTKLPAFYRHRILTGFC